MIPPAWRDVWICPLPNGHLQATGLDAAGRRQYLYHPAWRAQRRAKFDRVTAAAARLPEVRGEVADDLARPGMPLERAAAVAVRLLDLGYFRIGNDYYADANGSFGLTTLERRHVRGTPDGLAFRFVGKSGIEHRVTIEDAGAIAALQAMRRRRGGDRLLAYRNGSGWTDLGSVAVNAYLAELFGGEFTAKDFRSTRGPGRRALARSPEPGSFGGVPEARDARGGGRGGRLSREHPGHRAGVLHRPAGLRPLRVGRHDRGRRPSLGRPRCGRVPRRAGGAGAGGA